MGNARINYIRENLKIAEIKLELISEAISARLSSGKVTADQLANLSEVLRTAENVVKCEKETLEKALAEAVGEPYKEENNE